jgi:hypothetical protein
MSLDVVAECKEEEEKPKKAEREPKKAKREPKKAKKETKKANGNAAAAVAVAVDDSSDNHSSEELAELEKEAKQVFSSPVLCSAQPLLLDRNGLVSPLMMCRT